MRWLGVTLALLGVSAVLVAGIYLRDRDTSWRPPQRAAADFDARMVLTYVAGPDCGKRCSYKLLANPRDNHWLARIVDRSRAQCVDIDVEKFGIDESHGIAGIATVNCGSVGAAGD
jgi:hypothetical protein